MDFASRLSHYIANSLKFRESARLAYNGVLALVVVLHFMVGLPETGDVFSLDLILGLIMLAVLANLLFCLAYPVDWVLQFSQLPKAMKWGRWAVCMTGILFAAILAHYTAQELFMSPEAVRW